MTLYIVRAKSKNDLSGLRKEPEAGRLSKITTIWITLYRGLEKARFDINNSYATWVEEDYCSPPFDESTSYNVIAN